MGTVVAYETGSGRRYRVRYRTPENRQTDKRGFKTKREAQDFLAAVEVSKMRGEWLDPSRSRVRLDAWAEDWFESQVQIKSTTRSNYRYTLDRHIKPRWGAKRLDEVQHSSIQLWVNDLAASLAPSTVRQIYLVLAGMLRFAVRDGRLSRDPSEGIQLPRIAKSQHGYLTHSQVQLLASLCGDYGDVVLVLAYTGLRWGELSGLRVRSVDLNRRRLDVREQLTVARGRMVTSTPKSHARRSVPFPEVLTAAVARRTAGKDLDELVFTGPQGAALHGTNFRNRQFARAVAIARSSDLTFPKLVPHDLRHTAASLAIAAGANVKVVQRMLGHKSAAMTLDVYGDLFDDDLDSVANALNLRASAHILPTTEMNHVSTDVITSAQDR